MKFTHVQMCILSEVDWYETRLSKNYKLELIHLIDPSRSSVVFFTALFLFTGGFLLRRQELSDKSPCLNTTHSSRASCNSVPRQFSKSVVIIIDALKHDFAVFNESLRMEQAKPFQNRLPVFRADRGGRLYEFVADPPTTTMQRLKGLTTGTQ